MRFLFQITFCCYRGRLRCGGSSGNVPFTITSSVTFGIMKKSQNTFLKTQSGGNTIVFTMKNNKNRSSTWNSCLFLLIYDEEILHRIGQFVREIHKLVFVGNCLYHFARLFALGFDHIAVRVVGKFNTLFVLCAL